MIKTRIQFASGLVVVLAACPLYAANWTISPSVVVQETYTDNVTLASSNEQDDFITEINPTISIRGEGKRLQLKFDYKMENLIYANDSSRNDTNHQLSASANAELVERFLFLDATGSISQQLISNTGPVALDNLSVTGNRTDVYTYSLSPYVTHRFGGYVDSELRYTYRGTDSGQGASDSNSNAINLSLASGKRFTQLHWNFNFNHSELDRDTASDTSTENASGEIRYAVNRKLDVLAQGGYENNDIATTIRTNDGTYWSAGFDWHPSRKFSLQVLKGDSDQSATVRLNPLERTSFEATYRDRDVGLNPGNSWNASLNHRTRRSTWAATYSEDTTTLQDQLFDETAFYARYEPFYFSPTGNIADNILLGYEDKTTGFLIPISDVETPLTDEVFVRKRLRLSTSLNTGKSDVNVSVFTETREYIVAGDDETVIGGNASWGWKFAPRTRSNISAGWQKTDFRSSDREDKLWNVRLGITRSIRRDVTGSVDFRHLKNDSNTVTNSYDENRASVRLNIFF